MRASVLDLGSNSFHLLVADVDGDRLTPVARRLELLHLGAEVARYGHVRAAPLQMAVDTVTDLTELARSAGAERRGVVATSALREADNGPEVLAALGEAAGSPVRVLTGLEEAHLAYRGSRASLGAQAEPVLVLDLGGGSLELALGRGPVVEWADSLPLGVGRLSTLVRSDPAQDEDVRRLVAHVDTTIAAACGALAALRPGCVVGVGGTIRALARVAVAGRTGAEPDDVDRFALTRHDLGTVQDRLLVLDRAGRVAVPGVPEQRADHVHVGAVVLSRILDRLAVGTVVVSEAGLREGCLIEAVEEAAGRGRVSPAGGG